MSTYTLKKVKSFIGMEGKGLNADLCRDGKKVAFVIDEGCGGSMIFQWADRGQEWISVPFTGRDGQKYTLKVSPEENLFNEFLKTLPPWEFDGKKHEMTGDVFVGELADKIDELKWAKRQCKAKTLFRLPAEPDTSWHVVKTPFSPEVKQKIMERHGANLIFLNEQI